MNVVTNRNYQMIRNGRGKVAKIRSIRLSARQAGTNGQPVPESLAVRLPGFHAGFLQQQIKIFDGQRGKAVLGAQAVQIGPHAARSPDKLSDDEENAYKTPAMATRFTR